jgi:hypothetical protein
MYRESVGTLLDEQSIAQQAASHPRDKGEGEQPNHIVASLESDQSAREAKQKSGGQIDLDRQDELTFKHGAELNGSSSSAFVGVWYHGRGGWGGARI